MKGNSKLSYFLLVLAIVSLVSFAYVITHETQITIDSGAAAFRTMRWIFAGAGVLLLGVWAALVMTARSMQKKEIRQKMQETHRAQEEKAALSYRGGRLDEASMRNMIVHSFRDYNGGASGTVAGTPEAAQFREYLNQMDAMNTCQARLHTLLELNGASDPNQTEGMMDALEQNLFMNLRKAINWANAVNPQERMPDEISGKLKQIELDNGELLNTARELLTQLTDYINHQGDSRGAEETAGAFIEQLRLMIKIKEEE